MRLPRAVLRKARSAVSTGARSKYEKEPNGSFSSAGRLRRRACSSSEGDWISGIVFGATRGCPNARWGRPGINPAFGSRVRRGGQRQVDLEGHAAAVGLLHVHLSAMRADHRADDRESQARTAAVPAATWIGP